MQFNISIHDGVNLRDFADRLTGLGLPVTQQLDILNMLTAEIPDDRVAEVRAMDAVRAIQPDRQIRAL